MGNRIFNTWMGDPSRVLLLEAMVEEVEAQDLLSNIKYVGNVLLDGMHKLQEQHPTQVHSPRGEGGFLAFDARDPDHRDRLVAELRKRGIHCGGNGEFTLRLRPALNFKQQHAILFLAALKETLSMNLFLSCS